MHHAGDMFYSTSIPTGVVLLDTAFTISFTLFSILVYSPRTSTHSHDQTLGHHSTDLASAELTDTAYTMTVNHHGM